MQLRQLVIYLSAASIIAVFSSTSQAGDYLNSAHGNTGYGVDWRSGFAKANCAHCHEQHASVSAGANGYLLFSGDNNGQTTNFCFNCHDATAGSYQGVVNRSYSYRAGGWADPDPLMDNVKYAFSLNSSHNLADIVAYSALTFPTKYTDNSNACAVCHDPHLVQGDPANPDNFKASGASRGLAITDITASPSILFTKKMNPNITATAYQAPYRDPVSSAIYEPEGNSTWDGSNLPDYVTFCTDCHDTTTTVFGTQTLTPINWLVGGEIHGKGNAVDTSMLLPYSSGTTSYVLSCLDCHEPHGSANLSLLRGEVNGQATGLIATGFDFDKICRTCHDPTGVGLDWQAVHHAGSDPVYEQIAPCDACHPGPGTGRIDCSTCHFHGSDTTDFGVTPPNFPAGDRTTF